MYRNSDHVGTERTGTRDNAQVPNLAVNGIDMYYESTGSGRPLLLLGGLGLAVPDMRRLVEGLATSCRVIAVDNRGTGRSSKPAGPYAIEQMAEDALALMDRLDVQRTDVLGISMGGRVALSLALDHPDRVRRLVLVSTGPRAAGHRWLVRLGMLVANAPGVRGTQRQPWHAMKAQYDATTRFDCTDRLPDLHAPSLVVHGRADHIAPLSLAEQMQTSIPNAKLVTVEGGHLVSLLSRCDQVVASVAEFLAKDADLGA